MVLAALLETIPATELVVREVEAPQLTGPDDLLVQVAACGICGTDLHIMQGRSYRPGLPATLGHEIVGVVVDAGTPAASWIGRRVTATAFAGCGACALCAAGDERLCENLRKAMGLLNQPGGFAELMVLSASQAVAVPEALSDVAAASLADAGATALNTVGSLAVVPDSVVIVGAGPVGFLVAELLRARGHAPCLIESGRARADVASAAGYRTYRSADELDVAVGAVLDCTGSPAVLPWALRALAPRGLFVAVGYAVVPEVDMALVARKELTVRGIRSGRRRDLAAVLDLASTGGIKLPQISAYSLERISVGLADLRQGRIPGKVVVQVRP